jgi:hypothetical protein
LHLGPIPFFVRVSTIFRFQTAMIILVEHKNIQITQRYTHINDDELDKGYYEIFERPKA